MTTYNCLPDHNRTAALTEAAAVLAAGKLVVMPTDTVYGIACCLLYTSDAADDAPRV